MQATDQMLQSLFQVDGAPHHMLYREYTEITGNYMDRQKDEPLKVTATGMDVDGFTDMVVEQGDSPLWDNDDPSTWVPWGWEIKDPKKWVDYAKRATSRGHGLAQAQE